MAQLQGIAVRGFEELVRALERIEGGTGNFGVEYELQQRLTAIGEEVAKAAPAFVTDKYQNSGELQGSVKVSVTKKQASVYSTSVYGGAQNSGASPKAGWQARGPHIQRAKASQWMTKAVQSKQAFIAAEWEGLEDWVLREFER